MISLDEMKNLALTTEATEKESKARVDETSVVANVAEKTEGRIQRLFEYFI